MWISFTNQGFLVILGIVLLVRSSSTSSKYFNIGAMLSSSISERIFDDAVRTVNQNSTVPLNGIRLNSTSAVLSANPIRSALDVCDQVITHRVYVILVSHSNEQPNPPIAISYACGFYNIPVIGITARESIFSDKIFTSENLQI
ncbi:hypothetical protein QZH41_002417 [Actinostola sp. cb2023]|nr:hypothetical protein QZH41_002417 [Actinostola sp. cb2023]